MQKPASDVEWNWSRTHQFKATNVHRPDSVDELLEVIAVAADRGTTLHGIGTRHSFTGIGDGDALVDVSLLPEQFEIARDRASIRVNGGLTYSRLAELLHEPGLAIANLASLPHISIAGAVSTATHGSGDRNGNLATAVRSLDIAVSTGEVRRITRGDDDFGAAPVSLGALGIIVAVELDAEPSFEIEQQVHDNLGWHPVTTTFGALFGSAYSVSVFTDWRDRVQLWTKRRVDEPAVNHGALHSGSLAPEPRHPVPGEPTEACTEQRGAGPWSQRLPHFRAGATPSVGAEVQSEFFVDRRHAVDAIARLRTIGDDLTGILMASEIRTVCNDELWLSPQFNRDCVAFHFTWFHDVPAAHQAAQLVARTLAPLAPLPHWGKVFDPSQFNLGELYPRLPDVRRVQTEWDPGATFQTKWIMDTLAEETTH